MSRVLLLADDNPAHAATVLDHIEALLQPLRHSVYLYNPVGLPASRLLSLDEFEVVVVHYSVVLLSDYYLPPRLRQQITRYSGLKIQFLQDEMRWADRMRAMISELGIDILFSVAPQQARERLYGDISGLKVLPTLTGYVPDTLVGRAVPNLEERPIDLGYRGRNLPFWLGAHAQDKINIGREVLGRAANSGLSLDIAWEESDRIYGEDWIRFLSGCRATLACESGASITDFDGSVEAAVTQYLAGHPEAGFEEVSQAVLTPFEGNLPIVAVSPRVFEAAALRTALVMFPGHYNGVVEPECHYIVLQKDFSNLEAVLAQLRDLPRLHAMTERTYQDLIASGRYSYRVLTRHFEQTLSAACPGVGDSTFLWRYQMALLEREVFRRVAKWGAAWRGHRLVRRLRKLYHRVRGKLRTAGVSRSVRHPVLDRFE